MGILKAIWAVLLGTSSFLSATTTLSPYQVRSWGENSGLPAQSVNSIIQTRDGYLWLATFGGLARFDGYTFKIFDVVNTPELKLNRFVKLFEDRNGSLWIITEAMGVIRRQGDRYSGFSTQTGLPSDIVHSVGITRDGAIWFGTDKGACRLLGNTLSTFTKADGLFGDIVRQIYVDENDTVWIASQGGINRWRSGKLERFHSLEDPSLQLDFLGGDDQGEVYFSSLWKMWAVRNDSIRPLFDLGLTDMKIHHAVRDAHGGFWFCTFNGLVHWMNGTVEHYSSKTGLSGDNVKCIHFDREGNLWVGLEGAGFNQLRIGKIQSWAALAQMPQRSIVPILCDGQGGVWIGSNGKGLYRYTAKETIIYNKENGFCDSIWSLLLDRERRLWVGTWGDGLWKQLPSDRGFARVDWLPNLVICALLQDRDGSIWAGTENGLFHHRDNTTTHFTKKEGLVDHRIKYLFQDSQDRVWIGTLGGMCRLENGRFTNYTRENGLPGNHVRAIYEDEDGTFWIGTYGGGLSRLRNGAFFHFNSKNGLYDNVVSRIIEDKRGNLWMSCNRGIFRADRRELNAFADGRTSYYSCYNYGTGDGMLSSECNGGGQPAGWMDEAGRLWFPTIRGAVTVDPSRGNPIAPQVLVEELYSDGRLQPISGSLVLPPGKKRLEIRYTGLSFIASEKVRFRYRLDGFDDRWTEAGANRFATYTNLPPGRFTFRVRAASSEGIWSIGDAVLSFRIRPYFTQTAWFYGLCLVLAGSAVFGFFELRIRRLKAREQKLQHLVNERTRDLADSNHQLQEQSQRLVDTNRDLESSNRKLEEANQMLERLSNLDGLTGIANRRYFEKFIDNEWRRACREQWPLVVIMLDVDWFKAYNDIYGHLAGDDCLKQVATQLCVVKRAGDLVARYGGEEFAVVLANTDLDGARYIAEQMKERVEEAAIVHANSPTSPFVTISLGIAAIVPQPGMAYMELVMTADQALYQAKRDGRNRVVSAV